MTAQAPESFVPARRSAWLRLRDIVGPGLIAGAADDDPSGIATYSQAGAQFGFNLGWTLVLTYPLMCAIQLICAEIGRVTGLGLAGNLRRHYPKPLLYGLVGLLLIANTINLGADLGAMAAALGLLIRGPQLLYVVGFAVLSIVVEVYMRYPRYASLLRWLTLSLFAYVATVFLVGVPWLDVARDMAIPHIELSGAYLTVVVAVFGTTISPYLFFWQASEEVEEVRADPVAEPLRRAPHQAERELTRIHLDTFSGMAFSNIIALFIVLTTAATLHAHGIINVETSSQAAEALRPLAGEFAFTVFALGIVGTGLLAVPVLAGGAGLCARRSDAVEGGARKRAAPRPCFLSDDRGRNRRRGGAELHADRPDQGLVLERRDQRCRSGSLDGDDRPDGVAT